MGFAARLYNMGFGPQDEVGDGTGRCVTSLLRGLEVEDSYFSIIIDQRDR